MSHAMEATIELPTERFNECLSAQQEKEEEGESRNRPKAPQNIS